jgi:predicted PurR-regulated permease PerM
MTHITNRRVAMWTVVVLLVIGGFFFLWVIRNVLVLVFLSILLAAGIDPLVRVLRKGPFTRGTGILFIYLLILGVLGAITILVLIPLVNQGQKLIAALLDPATGQNALQNINDPFVKNLASQAYDGLSTVVKNLRITPETLSIGFTLLEIIFSVVTVFVICYYWSTEEALIKRFVLSFLSDEKKIKVRRIWSDIENKLGAWVRGQLIIMLVTGILSFAGYSLMGLEFAFPLACFAAIAELIPIVGPYIGGAPAVLIALTQNVTITLAVIVYIAIFQIIEGNVLVPRVMEKSIGIRPITVILGILIGSTLLGITGALLAVPIAATVQVIINKIFESNSDSETEKEALTPSIALPTNTKLEIDQK